MTNKTGRGAASTEPERQREGASERGFAAQGTNAGKQQGSHGGDTGRHDESIHHDAAFHHDTAAHHHREAAKHQAAGNHGDARRHADAAATHAAAARQHADKARGRRATNTPEDTGSSSPGAGEPAARGYIDQGGITAGRRSHGREDDGGARPRSEPTSASANRDEDANRNDAVHSDDPDEREDDPGETRGGRGPSRGVTAQRNGHGHKAP